MTEVRNVAATVHGRQLVRAPEHWPARQWLVGFHGYGQSADEFLEFMERIPAAREWLVVSVQALHPFYNRAQQVVANWMTRQDREHAIADNIAYVDAVLDDLEGVHGAPATLVFAGFSQGVAMAYRAAVSGRRSAHAVIAACGDVPPELEQIAGASWPRRVLLATGTRDEFYAPDRLEREAAALRVHGVEMRTLVFEGGHQWSAEIVEAADRLLREIAAD